MNCMSCLILKLTVMEGKIENTSLHDVNIISACHDGGLRCNLNQVMSVWCNHTWEITVCWEVKKIAKSVSTCERRNSQQRRCVWSHGCLKLSDWSGMRHMSQYFVDSIHSLKCGWEYHMCVARHLAMSPCGQNASRQYCFFLTKDIYMLNGECLLKVA